MIPADVFTVVEVKVEPYFELRKIGDKNRNSHHKWHLCFCFYRLITIDASQLCFEPLVVDNQDNF